MNAATAPHPRPGPNAVSAIVVAIPAHDEERLIARALAALRRDAAGARDAEGAAGLRCEALVLADGCRDATAAMARAASSPGMPARVVEREGAGGGRGQGGTGQGGAGWARRAALEAALGLCGPGAVLLTTDADAVIRPGTLAAIARAMEAGADLVCGAISTTLPEAVADAPSIRRIDGVSAPYAALVRELRFAVDRLHGPQPEGPCPHYVESGACIAIRPDLLRRLGGLPDVASGEDRALARAAERAGARIAYEAGAHAWVSPRLGGRAAGGMAETIRARLLDPDPEACAMLPSAAALAAHWREAVAAPAGAPRPALPVADPPLRASGLERDLPAMEALLRDEVRPAMEAAPRRVA